MSSILLLASAFSLVAAAQDSNSPYIDAMKRQMPQPEPSSGSYTEQEKKRIEAEDAAKSRDEEGGPASSKDYSEKLRQKLPAKPEEEGSYTEREKAKLAPKPEGGAIAAVKEGRSQLEMKRGGDIHHAAGFSIGAAMSYDITGDPGFEARPFSDVYGGKFIPNIAAFYEYQPFHSEWFGNIGIMIGGGVSYVTGAGKFQFTPPGFTEESRTQFSFATLPLNLSLDYRFNLLRAVRPYIAAGPSFIGYIEGRNDRVKNKFGYSTGLRFAGGVNILLDFFSSEAWELYEQWHVKHYYLTIEYQKNTALSGGVNFASSGVTAGMTFEY